MAIVATGVHPELGHPVLGHDWAESLTIAIPSSSSHPQTQHGLRPSPNKQVVPAMRAARPSRAQVAPKALFGGLFGGGSKSADDGAAAAPAVMICVDCGCVGCCRACVCVRREAERR